MVTTKYIILQVVADTTINNITIPSVRVLPAGKEILPLWWIEKYLADNNVSLKSPIYTMLKKWEKENER